MNKLVVHGDHMVSDHQPRLRSTCHLYKVALGKLPHYLSKGKPQFKWVKWQPLTQSCAFLLKFTIQMKTSKEHFPVVLFIILHRVVLTFEPVDKILWCYHSIETSSAVLSQGTIYLVGSSNFWVCGWNLMVLPFKWNLFSSTFTRYYLFSM